MCKGIIYRLKHDDCPPPLKFDFYVRGDTYKINKHTDSNFKEHYSLYKNDTLEREISIDSDELPTFSETQLNIGNTYEIRKKYNTFEENKHSWEFAGKLIEYKKPIHSSSVDAYGTINPHPHIVFEKTESIATSLFHQYEYRVLNKIEPYDYTKNKADYLVVSSDNEIICNVSRIDKTEIVLQCGKNGMYRVNDKGTNIPPLSLGGKRSKRTRKNRRPRKKFSRHHRSRK